MYIDKWLVGIVGNHFRAWACHTTGCHEGYSYLEPVVGEWYFLMFTYDGANTAKLYVNNEFQTTIIMDYPMSPGATTFQMGHGEGIYGCNCAIDEVRISNTVRVPEWPPPSATCPTINEWRGEYWNNTNLSGGSVLCRNDFSLYFDWGYGSPNPVINDDYYSARWIRSLLFQAGQYRFKVRHDDGARLYIDDILRLDEWDTCCSIHTVDVQLSDGYHTIRLEMFEQLGAAHAELWWEQLDISGWRVEYFNNDSLSGYPILVQDGGEIVNFDWRANSPNPLVQDDHFSVRWTRSTQFIEGDYQLEIFHDDGARLYVDGNLIFENLCIGCRLTERINHTMAAGTHQIRLEIFENTGWAAARLNWIALFVPGDADSDGKVDGVDYVIWLNHYDQITGNGASDGDFNGDGKVDGIDYVIWLNNYDWH